MQFSGQLSDIQLVYKLYSNFVAQGYSFQESKHLKLLSCWVNAFAEQ